MTWRSGQGARPKSSAGRVQPMGQVEDAIRWLEVRLNRRILPAAPDRAFWSLFEWRGMPLDDAPPGLHAAAARPTDLLVALTTYNRPEACERILSALPNLVANAGRPLNVHVLLIKDAGGAGYDAVGKVAHDCFGDQLTWLEGRSHLGRQGYWKTYQALFLAARLLRPAHVLFLQDDLEFSSSLLRDCYTRFEALAHDARPMVLYLFAADDDEPEGRWIHFRRREVIPGIRLTQWFDLAAFVMDRALLELLRYAVFPVSGRRWKNKPYSSGVGEQLTRRLFRRANVYQAMPPLVFHGAHPSEMNPEARSDRPLDNRGLAPPPST